MTPLSRSMDLMADAQKAREDLAVAQAALKEQRAFWLAERRKVYSLRAELKKLTAAAIQVIAALDETMMMNRAPDHARAERIAQIVGVLELANDSALHFGLDMSFKAMDQHKAKIVDAMKKPKGG